MSTLRKHVLERRTLQKLRAQQPAKHHHHVYVVLLKPAAKRLRLVRAINPERDPAKPCVYVGMTGLTPEERFGNHLRGVKAAAVVTRYGVRLLPELYAHLNRCRSRRQRRWNGIWRRT